MDAEIALEKLKRQFPELEEGILREALALNDNNYTRAENALKVSEDGGAGRLRQK